MEKMKFDALEEREMFPGYFGRFIHNGQTTLAKWNIKAGHSIPLHHHEHTQIMWVLEGEFWFELEGKEMIMTAGDVLSIPPNIPHRGNALTDCRIVDIFSPEREDYKS